jgi:hypothetical protein
VERGEKSIVDLIIESELVGTRAAFDACMQSPGSCRRGPTTPHSEKIQRMHSLLFQAGRETHMPSQVCTYITTIIRILYSARVDSQLDKPTKFTNHQFQTGAFVMK